jgi:hypothetical protein
MRKNTEQYIEWPEYCVTGPMYSTHSTSSYVDRSSHQFNHYATGCLKLRKLFKLADLNGSVDLNETHAIVQTEPRHVKRKTYSVRLIRYTEIFYNLNTFYL